MGTNRKEIPNEIISSSATVGSWPLRKIQNDSGWEHTTSSDTHITVKELSTYLQESGSDNSSNPQRKR